MFTLEREQLKLKESYANEVKNLLGADRTLQLIKSDRQFKEKMLKGLSKRQEKQRFKQKGF